MTNSSHTQRLVLTAVLLCCLLAACGEGASDEYPSQAGEPATVSVTVPALSDRARQGEALFNAQCSQCHGVDAAGTSEGPPLVHEIYEPGHHADYSFHLAVQRGTRQHHWEFGDMEPRPQVAAEDIDKIVCYVRELQFANGIFSDPSGLVACG